MIRILLTALVLAGVGGGCVVHGPGRHHGVYGPAIDVQVGHVHSDFCGHYSHGGHTYHNQGHRHGDGCGHSYRGGVWIVAH